MRKKPIHLMSEYFMGRGNRKHVFLWVPRSRPKSQVVRAPGETWKASYPGLVVAGVISVALCGAKTSHKST